MAKVSLSKIVKLLPNMKILIDDGVNIDEKGCYLINVAYERVSTDRQADLGFGLDIQEKDVLSFARRNDYKNLLLFIDDGYTGTNMDRPALQAIIQMINDYNSGLSNVRIDTFVVPRIDRLGRTLLGTLQFIQDYIVSQKDSKGSALNHNIEDINFISVAENYCRIEKNNPQGKFLLMLFASLAEYDRDLIVDKMKKGKTARASKGKYLGGGPKPYGYKYDKNIGKLVVVPDEAEIVREVYRLYIEEHLSPGVIADRFGFKYEQTVTNILRSKRMAGYITFNGEEYPGEHEAIVSIERWQEAQDELKKRGVSRGDPTYMLAGLLVCGECGAKMRYQKWNQKTGECKIVCYSHQKSKPYLVKDPDCPNKGYWQSDVEEAVIGELFKLNYSNNDERVTGSVTIDPIAALNEELHKEKRKLNRLYEFDEDDDDDVLREKIASSRQKIKRLEEQIIKEQTNSALWHRIEKAQKIVSTLQDGWNYMSDKEKKDVCQELIENIVIYKDNRIDVNLRLKNYINQ